LTDHKQDKGFLQTEDDYLLNCKFTRFGLQALPTSAILSPMNTRPDKGCKRRFFFMDNAEKIKKLQRINPKIMHSNAIAHDLENIGAYKNNYREYLLPGSSIDYDAELARVATADYDTVCAIFTMLTREALFCGEKFFKKHVESGVIDGILQRMTTLLEAEQ